MFSLKKPIGQVTLNKIDKDTGTVVSTHTYYNTITTLGEYEGNFGDLGFSKFNTISLSQTPTKGNIETLTNLNDFINPTEIKTDIINIDHNNLSIIKTARYDTPNNTLHIYTIALTDQNNHIGAYISLNVPYIQDKTDILDITYKINIEGINEYYNHEHTSFIIGDNGLNSLVNSFYYGNNNTKDYPNRLNIKSFYVNPINQPIYDMLKDNTYSNYLKLSNIINQTPYNKLIYHKEFSKKDLQGTIIKSYAVINDQTKIINALIPSTNNSFIYKPIQPIHSHSIKAKHPFTNMNELATGSGKLKLSVNIMDSWSKPTNEMIKVDICKTGNIKNMSAYYSVSFRDITGFYGDHNESICMDIPWIGTNNHISVYGKHNDGNINNYYYKEDFPDGQHILSYSNNTIMIMNIFDGSYHLIHNEIYHNFQSNNVSTCKIDEYGNIWVCTLDYGLYYIDNPIGDINNLYDKINHIKLPNAYNYACKDISFSSDNSKFILTDIGLYHFKDLSKINNDLIIYDLLKEFPRIGTYNNLYRVIVDYSSSTYQMALLYLDYKNSSSQQLRLLWWKPNLYHDEIKQFDDNNGLLPYQYNPINNEIYINSFRCSKYGHVWNSIDYGFSHTLINYVWGSNQVNKCIERKENTYTIKSIHYIYDSYNEPYIIISNNSYNIEIYDKYYSLKYTCPINMVDIPYGENHISFIFEKSKKGLVGIFNQYEDVQTFLLTSLSIKYNNNVHDIDLNNSTGSLLDHNTWKRYGWNSIIKQWELNYLKTLNNGNFKRIGFYPGTTYFNGMSSIEGICDIIINKELTIAYALDYIENTNNSTILHLYNPTCNLIIGNKNTINNTYLYIVYGREYIKNSDQYLFKKNEIIDNGINLKSNIVHILTYKNTFIYPNELPLNKVYHSCDNSYENNYNEYHLITDNSIKMNLPSNSISRNMLNVTNTTPLFYHDYITVKFNRNTNTYNNKIYLHTGILFGDVYYSNDINSRLFTNQDNCLNSISIKLYGDVNIIPEITYISNNEYSYFKLTQVNKPSVDFINNLNETTINYIRDYDTYIINIYENNVKIYTGSFTFNVELSRSMKSTYFFNMEMDKDITINQDYFLNLSNIQILDDNNNLTYTIDDNIACIDTYINSKLSGNSIVMYDDIPTQYDHLIVGRTSAISDVDSIYNSNRNYFKGDIKNIQLWDISWNQDIINEYSTNNSYNLIISDYLLNNKFIHIRNIKEDILDEVLPVSTSSTLNGINIEFKDNNQNETFIEGESYTAGILDGILKDNTVSFDVDISINKKPTYLTNYITDVITNNSSVINTIPSSNINIIDQPGMFCSYTKELQYDENLKYHNRIGQGKGLLNTIFNENKSSVSWKYSALTNSEFTGFYIYDKNTLVKSAGVELCYSEGILNMYIITENNGRYSYTGFSSKLITIDSTYTLTRNVIGGNIILSIDGESIYTYQASTNKLMFHTDTYINNIVVSYTRKDNILDIGCINEKTGIYDKDYLWVDDYNHGDLCIDNNPANYVYIEDPLWIPSITNIPDMEGTITILGKYGLVIFHPNDVGKIFSGTFRIIKK